MNDANAPYNICEINEDIREAPLLLALLRDLGIVLVSLTCGLSGIAWLNNAQFSGAALLSCLLGFAAVAVASLPLHEWGHYLGARQSGAYAPRNPITKVFPMFHFDIEGNSSRQFVYNGLGGNIAYLLFAAALWFALADSTPGHIAMQWTAIYLVIGSALQEGPIIVNTIRSGSAVDTWNAYLPKRGKIGRINLVISTTITLLLFLSFN